MKRIIPFLIALLWMTAAGAAPVTPFQGGTGVANDNTQTLTRSGLHALTITTTGATGVTLPTSGTLYALGGALGTPSSGTATNLTGLPIGGLTGLGTGVGTALGLNVGSAGAPVLFNGALGTPSSGTLTSATGLPISTGLTGAGTGILTALGINVGSAGAPVLFNGALGTPSSGTVTNLTGTASINTNGAHNGTVGATTPAAGTFTSVTNSGLTATRIPYAGTAGLLSDSANMVWDNTNTRATFGSGTTTSAGFTMGYGLATGNAALWSTSVGAPDATNFLLSGNSTNARINIPNNTGSIFFNYGGSGGTLIGQVDEISGPRITIGAGSTTRTGIVAGYSGSSGFANICSTAVGTCTTANYMLAGSSTLTQVNAPTGGNISLRINGSTIATTNATGFGVGVVPVVKNQSSLDGNVVAASMYSAGVEAYMAANSGAATRFLAIVSSASAVDGGAFTGNRSRGTSASPTAVVNGDLISLYQGQGFDGTTRQTAGSMSIIVDGTPSTGDMPGALVFSTTLDGTNVVVDRYKINNAGSFQLWNGAAWRTVMGVTNATLASGGCTSAALSGTQSGSSYTVVNVGTGCAGSQPLVLTLPSASRGWVCTSRNISNGAISAPRQTGAESTTSVTITNFGATTGLAGAWTDSDVVAVHCMGG